MTISGNLINIYSDFGKQTLEFELSDSNLVRTPSLVSTCDGGQQIIQACRIIIENSIPARIARKYIVENDNSANRRFEAEKKIYLLSYNEEDLLGSKFNPQLLNEMFANAKEYLSKLSNDWEESPQDEILNVKKKYTFLNNLEDLAVFEHTKFGLCTDVLIRIIINEKNLHKQAAVCTDFDNKIHLICDKQKIKEITDSIKLILEQINLKPINFSK